ncbi:MAG: polyprenyl synthetase family protein [Magnetococcales bacterium]|nr:polyprenyl synthetase family protein [Magnetococcales bacterium]
MSLTSAQVLKRLHALIGNDLKQTNQIIIDKLDSQVDLIPTMGQHLIESGGKRLRPILLLVSARMFGFTGNNHALLAAVIEFIHTATLLHDDVVDMSSTRRGQETANTVWGPKAPVLVGDFLFSRSFQILVEHADLKVLKIVADACAIISEGEVLQLEVANNLGTSEEKYLEVVTCKTATLFSAAAQVGGVVAGCSEEIQTRLHDYGIFLGKAYQVVDDALDYSATQETLGKSIGDDFQEGKITLPVIHAYGNGTEEERKFWETCVQDRKQEKDSLQRAIQLIRERGSLDYAINKARHFADQAIAALEPLPDGPEKEAMIMLADFSVDRSY